jgi:hypothetical protein
VPTWLFAEFVLQVTVSGFRCKNVCNTHWKGKPKETKLQKLTRTLRFSASGFLIDSNCLRDDACNFKEGSRMVIGHVMLQGAATIHRGNSRSSRQYLENAMGLKSDHDQFSGSIVSPV